MIGKVERIQSRDMHKGNSGFGNGVVVGVVMGVILTLLFTTKKGRKILRILSEEGFEKVKKWETILDSNSGGFSSLACSIVTLLPSLNRSVMNSPVRNRSIFCFLGDVLRSRARDVI